MRRGAQARVATAGLLVALLGAGCTLRSPKAAPPTSVARLSVATTTTSVLVATAPCTPQALEAPEGPTASIGTTTYACTGPWAYARVSVGAGEGQLLTEVQAFAARGGAWQLADTALVCAKRQIAESLFARACATG